MSAKKIRECIKVGLQEFPEDCYPPGWMDWWKQAHDTAKWVRDRAEQEQDALRMEPIPF
jgi:hypothetical protein